MVGPAPSLLLLGSATIPWEKERAGGIQCSTGHTLIGGLERCQRVIQCTERGVYIANILLRGSGDMPPPKHFYKMNPRLNLVGFGSLDDYPKFVFKPPVIMPFHTKTRGGGVGWGGGGSKR